MAASWQNVGVPETVAGLANPGAHVAGGVNLALGAGRSPRPWQRLTLAITVEAGALMSFYPTVLVCVVVCA